MVLDSISDIHHSLGSIWLPLAATMVVILLVVGHRIKRDKGQQLPPGPFKWPIVGCLPAVGFKHRHRTFYELSKKHGAVMHVPIGAANFIVVHGASVAEELLKTKDVQFCSRPLGMTGQYLGFDHEDLNLSPYNANWRAARRAFSADLLARSRLHLQAPMRRREVSRSLKYVFETASTGQAINISLLADDLLRNIISQMLFGKRYFMEDDHANGGITSALLSFEADLREGIYLWGELNLADFFPRLARIWNPQDLEPRFRRLRQRLEHLFQLIIDDHRARRRLPCDGDEDDFISTLLSQKQLSDNQLMGIMSNALIAGIDTTARAIEWAMAELVSNGEVMEKAQGELDRVIGREKLFVMMEEGEVGEQLKYIEAVGKEVLRVHPSAPMDDPHLNEAASSLGGYLIPPESIVLLNLWALGQDPSLWHDPSRFNPDRFLYMNGYPPFHHLPFSSGRRKCPAYHFATLVLEQAVAALVQAFDWTPSGKLDLEEGDGIVVGLKNPLMLFATPRLPPHAYEELPME